MENYERKYGAHRVIEPAGALPQPAWRIDNSMDSVGEDEILIEVSTLNIDSASFTQLERAAGHDTDKIKSEIEKIVNDRGKMHNPVTGSGGMLIGSVAQISDRLSARDGLKAGDKIATLVSLSLTPLKIERILGIKPEIDQVAVKAKAILFESGIYAKLPTDMSETVALAALDVAGAPAQTARLVKPGDTVLVIGGAGKSGLLCLHEAKKRAGVSGKVIALTHNQKGIDRINRLELADATVLAAADNPMESLRNFLEVSGGILADLVINCVNVENCEMSSILCCKDNGIIYFFSMATSFTKAALGAEGVGKDVEMIVGNGYAKDHAAITLQVLRENKKLYEYIKTNYA